MSQEKSGKEYMIENFEAPFAMHPPFVQSYVNYVSTYHVHDSMYEIYVFLEGDVSYYIDGKRYRLERGNLLIITPGTIHKAFIQSMDSYKRLVLNVNENMLPALSSENTDLAKELRTYGNQLFRLPESELLYLLNLSNTMYHIFEKSYIKRQEPSFGDDLRLTSYLTIYLVQICCALRKENAFVPCPTDEPMEQIARYIDRHLTGDLRLPMIANAFHMSKSSMCQKFRDYYNTSLGDYITTKRLVLSQKYLLEGKSISDSCYLSGFHDYTHYLKTFKKKCGLTPKEYRKTWAALPQRF